MNTMIQKACLSLFGLVLAGNLHATTFNYNNGDVLVCFRPSGSGSYDLVVNAGSIATFTNLSVGGKITINPTFYTGTQLSKVGTNSISWSAFAYYDATAGTNRQNTIFITNPRYDNNTQTDPLYRDFPSQQANTISYLKSIASGATNYVNVTNASSATASLVPESASVPPYISYTAGLGAQDNFHGTFQTDPEQSTGSGFTTGGQPVRSDFYWLSPAKDGSSGIYLGYFELATNGVLTYTSGPSVSAVVAATNLSISRTGNVTSVKFTTGASGTYTLRGSTSLSLPRTSWSTLTSVSGNGGQQTLTDTATNAFKYYFISAQ